MATTRRGGIGITMTNTPQEEVEEIANDMVEALTKFEEDQIDMTLEAKEGSIAKSPTFRKAVSYLKQFIEE